MVLTDVSADGAKAHNNKTLDDLTAQLSFYFALKKIDIIRVHNVAKTKQALDLAAHLI